MTGYVEYGRMHVVASDGSHNTESVLLHNDEDWMVRITHYQDDGEITMTIDRYETGAAAMSELLTTCGWGYIIRPEYDARL